MPHGNNRHLGFLPQRCGVARKASLRCDLSIADLTVVIQESGEEIYAHKYEDLEQLRANIEEFIEEYYNRHGCTLRWATDPRKNSSARPKTKPNLVAHGWSLL
jgi:hypothetical protein